MYGSGTKHASKPYMQGSRLFGFVAATGLLLSLPSLAEAEDLAITLRPTGLSQIADAAMRFFPEEIPVDKTIEARIVDCPLTDDDTIATVDNIVGAVDWNDLSLEVSNGMLWSTQTST